MGGGIWQRGPGLYRKGESERESMGCEDEGVDESVGLGGLGCGVM